MNKEVFERMLKEFQELSERTNKCIEFILDEEKFNKLHMINRDLLIAQLKPMETYISILSIRLGINGTTENLSQNSEDNTNSISEAEEPADEIITGE